MSILEARIDTTDTWDKACHITLAGDIRRWDALILYEELLDAFDRGVVVAVVELTDVTYLDQIAFAVLVEAAERQRDAGGELFVAVRVVSRLGYTLRPLSPDEPEELRGLHPALDRPLDAGDAAR
jgi:anti-anti-sigma factor